MRFFKNLLLFVAILVVLIGIAGFFLPKTAHVERAITINAPAEKIFPHIGDFKAWEKWSPWFGLDPEAVYTYEGSGMGARTTWTSEDKSVGSGSQTITAWNPPTSLGTALDFGAQGAADATFTLTPTGTGTRVVWAFDTDFSDSFVGRYFGLMMDKMVGGSFEQGLNSLKKVVEES